MLVNNAADTTRIAKRYPFLDVDRQDWLSQFDTNLHGPFSLIQAVLPSMLSAHQGVIVNMSSGAADLTSVAAGSKGGPPNPQGERYAYGASKAALNRLGNAVATEFHNAGIAVMMVDPGSTRTELVELMSGAGDVEGSAGPIDVPVKAVIHMITCDDPMQFSGQSFYAAEFVREHRL